MHITTIPTYSAFLAELCQRADVSSVLTPDFHKKSLKLYMNSSRLLYRTAELYRRTGDLPNAYVLYLKYTNLLVYAFPKHRQYHAMQPVEDMRELKRNAVLAMDALEELRVGLELWWGEHVKPLISAGTVYDGILNAGTASVDTASADHVQDGKYQQDRQDLQYRQDRQHETEIDDSAITAAERRRSEIEKFYQEQFKSSISTIDTSNTVAEAKSPTVQKANVDRVQAVSKSISKPMADVKVEQVYLTEGGMPLRIVKVPFALIDVFMRIASGNTGNNVETCGVLGGTLTSATNTFTITHLIVPKQHGTSDTCVMVREEEVAEAAISHNLMTLGWIHTHPTQSCFMSSVDQHTQFPFQALMAEAVAVVVAPRRTPNYGVFRLTDPPGMSTVGRCAQSGFHPHPDNTYCELVHTAHGHVKMDHCLHLTVIDLR